MLPADYISGNIYFLRGTTMFTKKQLWALLIPLMVEQVLNSLMGTADTMMVSNVGSAAISAVSLVDSINTLILNIFSALATGGAIVCSQYIGKQRTCSRKAAHTVNVCDIYRYFSDMCDIPCSAFITHIRQG